MESNDPAVTLWQQVLALVKDDDRVAASTYGFLRVAEPKGIMGGTLYLDVPNDLTRSMLEQTARDPILQAIEQIDGGQTVSTFGVVINTGMGEPRESAPSASAPLQPVTPADSRNEPEQATEPRRDFTARTEQPPEPEARRLSLAPTMGVLPERRVDIPGSAGGSGEPESRLNAKYTFENFVSGPSNRLAYAAAVAVAEAPGLSYNPLFIYGDSGLGKTHLLHAIGHTARSMYPKIQVRYVSSEEFTNDFINAVQSGQGQSFHARYRHVDILLIDDIAFLQGKEETQEAFFHTFNTLHDQNKQVVITSDVPPKRLTGFEERMRTRFEWGLMTDVQSPDLETRIVIVRKKAQLEHVMLPDDVVEFIATRVTTSIRELEGTLIRVMAYANLNNQPIDIALCQSVLKDLGSGTEQSVIDPVDIINQTASYFRLQPEDLYGSNRSAAIVVPRQIAIYLCREMTSLSLPKIGQLFGNRDHSTVLHAHRKIARVMLEQRDVYNQVTELSALIRQGAS